MQTAKKRILPARQLSIPGLFSQIVYTRYRCRGSKENDTITPGVENFLLLLVESLWEVWIKAPLSSWENLWSLISERKNRATLRWLHTICTPFDAVIDLVGKTKHHFWKSKHLIPFMIIRANSSVHHTSKCDVAGLGQTPNPALKTCSHVWIPLLILSVNMLIK